MRWMCLVVMAIDLSAQELSPEVLLLARIKVKMAENLKGLPNYTCLQTIERSTRDAGNRRYRPLDTVRVEVALVDGKELFAWPGEKNFQERDISEIASGGAIGNGNFALHAKSVFLTNAPTFQYLEKRTEGGRETVAYAFRVPQFRSGFNLRVGPSESIVGYHGTFWADAKTLDLIRLELKVDEIPPHLQLQGASDSMEYQRVHIGSSDFLLPQSSELVMIDIRGGTNRNRTAFSSCRQYAGESVLSFDDPPPEVTSARAPEPAAIILPAGLRMELRLDSDITFGKSAVGDVVTASLRNAVKDHERVILAKGTIVRGRIMRLEKLNSGAYAVGIDFNTAESGAMRATMTGHIEPADAGTNSLRFSQPRILPSRLDRRVLVVQSPRGLQVLPRGYMVLVRTMKSNSGEGEQQ